MDKEEVCEDLRCVTMFSDGLPEICVGPLRLTLPSLAGFQAPMRKGDVRDPRHGQRRAAGCMGFLAWVPLDLPENPDMYLYIR